MPYGICTFPLVVLCISQLLYVVAMILYSLTYFELLFLFLMGITVCGCNILIKNAGVG